MIDGGLGLVDFKTSAKPYPDHLIALAAHGRLWEENHPQQRLSSYHLIILPKDGSAFQHHAYADLGPQWKLFTLYLEAYRLDKACAGIKSVPAVAPAPVTVTADVPKPRRSRKSPPAKVPSLAAPAAAPLTMAEILRSYGHVPAEVPTC